MMLRPVKVCSGEKRKPNQFQLWMWAHLEWNNFGWLETLLNLELPACCIYQSWIRWFVATGYIWSWNLWGCIRRDFGYNCGQVQNMLIYGCWLNMKLKPGRVFEERWYSIYRSWVCRPVVTTPHLPISFACFDSLPSHTGFANHPDGRNCQQQSNSQVLPPSSTYVVSISDHVIQVHNFTVLKSIVERVHSSLFFSIYIALN